MSATTAPPASQDSGGQVCKHCGIEVRLVHWALGAEWMHSPYPHKTRDSYRYCRLVVAEPGVPPQDRAAADRWLAAQGDEPLPEATA